MKLQLIEQCRQWWKLWSIRLNALGLMILAWVQFNPVDVLGVWNMMPEAVREVLSPSVMRWVGGVLIALAMLARLVKQPKLDKPDAK